ncbi:MAG: hypothetical protein K6347_07105 [Campylobacterales bacterium]
MQIGGSGLNWPSYKSSLGHLEKAGTSVVAKEPISSLSTHASASSSVIEEGEQQKRETYNEASQDLLKKLERPDIKALLSKLQARDAEVRAHEAAHLAAGGGVVMGGASFTYQMGPDGKQYAIGGEVPIDMSTGSTPEETQQKMRRVRAAALAPASPSPQDLKVAATASMIETKARIEELAKQKEEAAMYERQRALKAYRSKVPDSPNTT